MKLSVEIPFTWDWSKNKMWLKRRDGGFYLNKKTKNLSHELFLAIRSKRPNFTPKKKVYITIFAELSNHRGDAVNLVDTLLDAVKGAINIDDRWFAIKSLDWEIKPNGKIKIDIEQP